MLKQYRPNIERQKWLYSMMKSREIMRRRRLAGRTIDPNQKPIPDNSEPWLKNGVQTAADAFWISDQIVKTSKQWQISP